MKRAGGAVAEGEGEHAVDLRHGVVRIHSSHLTYAPQETRDTRRPLSPAPIVGAIGPAMIGTVVVLVASASPAAAAITNPAPAAAGGPHAAFTAPSTIIAGTPTVLSAVTSTPTGTLTYHWDLDGTGALPRPLLSYLYPDRDRGPLSDEAMAAATTALKLAGPALYGTYAVADFAADSSPAAKEFATKYEATYKSAPDYHGAWTYDAVHVLALAINNAKSLEPQKIREAILSVKDYPGVEGTYNFDQNGDGLHSYNVVKNDNGKIVFIKHIDFNE